MNRKFLIAISIVFAVVIGLWIWTLAIPKNIINIGGSGSVDPLMQRVTNKYKNTKKQSFVYSSTGSSSGINNLKKSVYDIGFISKEVPDGAFDEGKIQSVPSEVFQSSVENFKNYFNGDEQQGIYQSVNFANDAIVFIYNDQDTGFEPFEEEFYLNVSNTGLIEKNNILKSIYENNNQKHLLSWYDLAKLIKDDNNLTGSDWDNKLAAVNKNINVEPYASTPGSGTRTSFENLTGVNPGEAVNQYGNNGSIFSQISASKGAFGFVNLAFALETQQPKFNLKTVVIKKGTDSWNIGKTQAQGDPDPFAYPLTRPFIAIFYNDKNNKKMNEILDFVYWFATSSDLKTDYQEEGLKQLMSLDSDNNLTKTNLDFISWKKRKVDYEIKK